MALGLPGLLLSVLRRGSVGLCVSGRSGLFIVLRMSESKQWGRMWRPSLRLSEGERARMKMLSLIPLSCQPDSLDRIFCHRTGNDAERQQRAA